MKKITISLLAVLLVACVLPACSGKNSQRDALVKQWQTAVAASEQDKYKQANVGLLQQIAAQLSALGPQGIDPLLDILADPKADPRTKMLVTISVTQALTKENLARVAALTDAKYEVNTRVDAAHIIASFDDPELNKRADELLKDPEPRVRLAVFHMRLMKGDPEALQGVDAAWNDPATPLNDRSQIVLGIPESVAPKHIKIFTDALADNKLQPAARLRAITILGRFGDASVLPNLETAANTDADAEVKKSAEAAWEALKSRLEGTPTTPGESTAPAASAAAAPVPAPTPVPTPTPVPAPTAVPVPTTPPPSAK